MHSLRTLPLLLPHALAAACLAGPLEAPSGAVGPTMKPLIEIEPRTAINPSNTPGDNDATPSVFRITQPGSYYLTANVTVPNNTAAIEIVASDVTIDLAGFTIARSGVGAGTASLIQPGVSGVQNVIVRNGTLRNSGRHGIDLGVNARAERLRVINSNDAGISVGNRGVVLECLVDGAGSNGVSASSDARIVGCTIAAAGVHGIEASTNSEVAQCRVNGSGQHGILVAYGSSVRGCAVRGSGQWGITGSLNSGAEIFQDNLLTLNNAGGIRVYATSTVSGNAITSPTSTAPNILVVNDGNRITNNTTSSGADCVRIEPTGEDNLVVGNQAFNPASGNGFANINLNANVVGPVQTAAGYIVSTSPYANFSR